MIFLAGLSWGGDLAQELYARQPGKVASLILADTYAGWKGSLPEDVCAARLRSCLRESELEARDFVPDWIPELLSEDAPDELRDELAAIMSSFHPVGYRAMVRAFAELDTRPVLPRIQVPTLLLWGAADRRSSLAVAGQLHDAIPGATLTVIPGAGHVSNLEQSDLFNDAVRRFC